MRSPRLGLILAAALFAAGFASFFFRAAFPPAPPPPRLGLVPDAELIDASGRAFRLSELKGPWVADFIFTRCAGQCPLMTAQMRRLAARLPGVRLVSFTVDPADTPEALQAFKKRHQAEWLFLAGKGEDVRRLCRDGFHLAVAEGKDPSELIIHSNRLVLVDGEREIRGYFDAEDAAALEQLVRQAAALRRGAP